MESKTEDIVIAEIEYLKPDPLYGEERPYSIATQPPPGIKRTNIAQGSVRTPLRSVRGMEDNLSLYTHGFEWACHELTYEVNVDANVDRYMDDMGSFLQKHLNASKVIVYDFVVRLPIPGLTFTRIDFAVCFTPVPRTAPTQCRYRSTKRDYENLI